MSDIYEDALARRTERLNQAIARVETALKEKHPGVSASTPFPMADGGILRFGHFGDRWQLLIASHTGILTPLSNSSRALRMAAMHLLDSLDAALSDARSLLESELDTATAVANNFVERCQR